MTKRTGTSSQRVADDWRPETETERLRRQAREMDLTARLAWLEDITTFAAELRPPKAQG
jgi:hypothetical protein